MRTDDPSDINHPYSKRTKLRGKLPWFLIKLGIASKGKDCNLVNAEHHWYKIDDESSGCYHCEVVAKGKKWFVENET